MAASLAILRKSTDVRIVAILTFSLLCAVAPLDATQLFLVFIGAVAYALLQPLDVPVRRTKSMGHSTYQPKEASPKKHLSPARGSKYVAPSSRQDANQQASWRTHQPPPGLAPLARTSWNSRTPPPTGKSVAVAGGAKVPPTPTTALNTVSPAVSPGVWQPSAQPIIAPMFKASTWDAQIDELVPQLMPTKESDQAVERMVHYIKGVIQEIVPSAEVAGFASSALLRGRAYGVAVPDVDVVVSCSPQALISHFHAGKTKTPRVETRQLHKAALRILTDRLVGTSLFKFRRSAFSAEDPKVTMLASATFGAHGDAIPFDFSVNVVTPVHSAALLEECGRQDLRAKQLVLLVRRWARDRGICHVAKGHLSPYAWTTLTIYFLQIHQNVMSPLSDIEVTSSLAGPSRETPAKGDTSLGALFKEFLKFVATLSFQDQVITVRLGQCCAPNKEMSLHYVQGDGGLEPCINIEDPFDQKRNLGRSMNILGLQRFREETTRGARLACDETSVSELLEPWVPDDAEKAALQQ